MPSQRTLLLAHRYQHQVEELLDLYYEHGARFEVPCQALPGLCRWLGWKLTFSILPQDRWSECDPLRKEIRITKDLRSRIEFPGRARAIAHACIAMELAHAILHSAQFSTRQSRRNLARWNFEARLFACVLLCPWRLLSARPEIAALRSNSLTQRQRWQRLHRLAEDFGTTPSFMFSALVLHGVLERRPEGGIQAPCVLAIHARSFQPAA
jgi:hypothetical protein